MSSRSHRQRNLLSDLQGRREGRESTPGRGTLRRSPAFARLHRLNLARPRSPGRRFYLRALGQVRAGALAPALSVPVTVQAQELALEEDLSRSQAAGEIWGLLILLAVLALAVHLVLKAKGFKQLRELAKALAFFASAYLAGFFFLASTSCIARFLQWFGLERDISSLIAVPLGLLVAYKIYSIYEKWRIHK